MACYRTSVVLMQEQNDDMENIWHRLSKLGDISTANDIKLILSDNLSISFRFYDSETHGVAQLICHSEHLFFINKVIKVMGLEEIQKGDVYAYTHS